MMVTRFGYGGGVAAGFAFTMVWLVAVPYQPAGILLEPFVIPIVSNLIALAGRWFMFVV